MRTLTRNPIADLVDTAEKFMEAVTADCLMLPGHESECHCPTHERARVLAEELRLVIQVVRGC